MSETCIVDLRARRIFDSRGSETIEVEVYTRKALGRASAPAGASKGKWEAVSYPEGGVEEAVKRVLVTVKPRLIGFDSADQVNVDKALREIDGTHNFSKIGGNTAYAISLAVADAASKSLGIPLYRHLGGTMIKSLPYPLGNVLGGGKHAGGECPDIQEYLILSVGAKKFAEAYIGNREVHRTLRRVLEERNIPFFGGRGDEGAWAPKMSNNEAFEVIAESVKRASEKLGFEIRFGVDVAASSFWDEEKGKYMYKYGKPLDKGEQMEYILDCIDRYKLIYVEDPLHEEDFEGFKELTKKAGDRCMICGDDIFVTNVERLRKGIETSAGNAVIIKPNQIGTITDAYEATKLAQKNGYVAVFSHRSGETVDGHLAHLAVAFNCPIVKIGVLGGERIAKINEFLRIEEHMGSQASMHGIGVK
ncbi:MAG: phosphopyruvate hydratase [Candidatus Bathyarchaeia archaeon]